MRLTQVNILKSVVMHLFLFMKDYFLEKNFILQPGFFHVRDAQTSPSTQVVKECVKKIHNSRAGSHRTTEQLLLRAAEEKTSIFQLTLPLANK